MFKVIWDNNNCIKLTMSSAGEALNSLPRPVFYEELDLLGLNDRGWVYPMCAEPLLWACDRRYFYNGTLVMEVAGGDVFEETKVEILPAGENLHLKPVDMDYLRKRNENSMFLIEHEAMDFINQTYRRYRGIKDVALKNPDIDFAQLAERLEKKTKQEHVVVKEECDSFDIMPLTEAQAQGKSPILNSKIDMFVVSFSGGKDSQVILDLVSRVVPSHDFVVIYSDTGYELPTSIRLYDRVEKYYQTKYPDMKFYTAANHQPVLYYWDKMGSPSRMLRWCCSVMKSAPLSRLLKDIAGTGKQPNAILFDGVRAEESANRANRSRVGKNVKHNNIINISPILNWNSTETYLYILLNALPFNDAYRKGFSRVGCVICPYSSKWSESLASRIYPTAINPFLDNIRASLEKSKVSGIDNYIKLGKWKERAGGRSIECTSNVTFIEESLDFKATIVNPRENPYMWLNVLGEYHGEQIDNIFNGTLKYRDRLLKFKFTENSANTITVEFFGVNNDVVLISHIKKVLYKTTYCVHCEVCEVECPTGALSVVPKVVVDTSKCVHCLKCIDFDGKGCISASSVSISTGDNVPKAAQSLKSGINRYNDGMGLREMWLTKYFRSYQTFFDNDSHGLNPRYQIPPFINWLRDANILNSGDKVISEFGELLASHFGNNPNSVWELIYINLCENSEICKWFHSSIAFDIPYTKQELEICLQNAYPSLMDRTLKNPLNSLLNTFKESPLGSTMPILTVVSINKKSAYIRKGYDMSLVAFAYSLYRYAEIHNRYSMTISEFYNEDQKEGVYRQFGIKREIFEQNLRSLQMDSNHILRAELNMGLDNIILREDLSSIDIIKMFL